ALPRLATQYRWPSWWRRHIGAMRRRWRGTVSKAWPVRRPEAPAPRFLRRRQQLAEQRRQFRPRARQILAAPGNDAPQVADRLCEVVVDDDVVELAVVGHVGRGIAQAPRDDLRGVGRAPRQPFGERAARGRQNEYAHALRHGAAHLLRALPVDF